MKHLTFSIFATLCFLVLQFSPGEPAQFQSRGGIVGQPSLGSPSSSAAFAGSRGVIVTPGRAQVLRPSPFQLGIIAPNHRHHHYHIFFVPFLGYPFVGSPCYGPFWPYFVYSSYCGYHLPAYTATDLYYAPMPYGSVGIPYTDFGNSSAPFSLNDQNSSASSKGAEPAMQYNQFATQAEEAFRTGDYDRAVRAWRHAIVEEPKDASAIIMLAQSLFAMAQYDEAAGATQLAMMLLPEDQWLATAKNSKSLYRNNKQYLDQLSGLEKAVEKAPSDPALRFELGFQYALSDQQDLALLQLDKLIELVPGDQLGHKLRDLVAHKRMEASASLSPSSSAASEANNGTQ
jgi:hypothetical protein